MIKRSVSIAVLGSVLTLGGCAGSADHEVVSAYSASDEVMNCEQLTAEQVRVQAIINAVNQDKDDVTGKDMLDGLLWFPFNLIAKNSNYNSAINAANTRLMRIDSLRQEKTCSEDQLVEAEKSLELRLQELKSLREKDLITEEEYNQSRKKALSRT